MEEPKRRSWLKKKPCRLVWLEADEKREGITKQARAAFGARRAADHLLGVKPKGGR